MIQRHTQAWIVLFKPVYLYFYTSKVLPGPAQLVTATHELWEAWATSLICNQLQPPLTPSCRGYCRLSNVRRRKFHLSLGCSKSWPTALAEGLNVRDGEWEQTQLGARPLLLTFTRLQLWTQGQSRQLEARTSSTATARVGLPSGKALCNEMVWTELRNINVNKIAAAKAPRNRGNMWEISLVCQHCPRISVFESRIQPWCFPFWLSL